MFLTGFMASGKTAVGGILAELLGRPFIDLDGEVERHSGMTIRQIFDCRGEAFFRQVESEALARLPSHPAAVVATGGGTMMAPANRRLLRESGVSFWLDVPLEIMILRLESQEGEVRPLFRDAEQARELYGQRREAYRRADYRIPIRSGEMPEIVARRIAHIFGDTACDT
jgi:shikimate kinase